MEDAKPLARLRLYRTRNVGHVTFRRLLMTFENAQNALDALPDIARRGGLRHLKTYLEARAIEELDAIERIGGHALFTSEDDFPALLDMAENVPPVHMALGDPVHLSQPNIAIVGPRNASANGRGFAGTLAAELVAAGHVFVSEMARGIDTSADIDALPFDTVAILAGGVCIVYPREDVDLHAHIIE